MIDITKQVMELNAGWYNVVAQAMRLDTKTFSVGTGDARVADQRFEWSVPDVGRGTAARRDGVL